MTQLQLREKIEEIKYQINTLKSITDTTIDEDKLIDQLIDKLFTKRTGLISELVDLINKEN